MIYTYILIILVMLITIGLFGFLVLEINKIHKKHYEISAIVETISDLILINNGLPNSDIDDDLDINLKQITTEDNFTTDISNKVNNRKAHYLVYMTFNPNPIIPNLPLGTLVLRMEDIKYKVLIKKQLDNVFKDDFYNMFPIPGLKFKVIVDINYDYTKDIYLKYALTYLTEYDIIDKDMIQVYLGTDTVPILKSGLPKVEELFEYIDKDNQEETV